MGNSKLQDKVTLITGASAGIGEALAKELALHGTKLVLTARRKNKLENLKSAITRDSKDIIISKCDVTNWQDLEAVIDLTHQNFGLLDIVIANAAIPMHGKFESLQLQDYRTEFETNIFGVLQTCYAALDDLKKTKGTLVVIGSISGYMSAPGSSAYAMSKYAVRAFAEAVHGELSEHDIKVVLISPGFIESELRMIDNKGNFHPDYKDWVPSALVMPADTAAKKMVKAIIRGKREKFITIHGYIAYCFRQYLPWLYFLVINRLNRKFRPHTN